jgi:glycosyltransferase involved in cell wall biosynthesis
MNNSPLLSVIIPTHNRPQFLARAVKSALDSSINGNVEVIVIPNGGDVTWKESLSTLLNDARVLVSPIQKGHANAARNLGLKLAKGKYIRFLDDDDYFIVDGAVKQLELMEKSNVELCGGSLAVVGSSGKILNILKVLATEDFVTGQLSSQGRTSPQFYIYRSEAIKKLVWQESIDIGQDTHWTHSMCRMKDWTWVCIDEVVCSWVQHSTNQISQKYKVSEHLKLQEQYKWETIQTLKSQGRLTEEREKVAAKCLWDLIHAGFFLSPFYWSKVINKTQKQFPHTYPKISIYEKRYGRLIPPLLLEICMMPKRWLNFLYRQCLVKLGCSSQW